MNLAIDFMSGLVGYRLVKELYNSSRTIVCRAVRVEDEYPVVVKLLKRDYPSFPELLQFRNQYTITKNLDLPGVIKTYALENCRNSYALITEDFGGISLKEYALTHPLQIGEFLAIALQLSESLNGLYHHRIIHKDIKPANILINADTKQVKLIDFSIASLLPKETQEISNPNVLEGTLAYISPEQTGRMNRGIDYRTDFYSVGVTFYELLTGKLPFVSNEVMELVHCHLAKQPPALGGRGEIPQVLSDLVMKLMAKNAEERYQSALGLKSDLENCLSQWQKQGKIATFTLGERDICDRFIIPEKLYGREAEVAQLLEAFERVSNLISDTKYQKSVQSVCPRSELMLVAGFSGIGKTAVINEVHKPITKKRGYFIKGKFDQFNRNIPFSAFVQAFRSLMGQLLGESDLELANWQRQILKAVGENGQVIIDVIPELERIIGQQPRVPELSGIAAQNRFNLLFGQFVNVFTTKEHPLVIFLDDLQWADSASLNLLKLLMDESEAGYLLVLGAYRDNEVFPTHPLMLTLDELQQQGRKINTLTLAPLNEVNITRLVADTLLCKTEIAAPLSQLVYQKTQGNPFFTTQFLQGLHEDGCITFAPDLGYWQCNLTKVRQLALTDDVVAFMVGRLRKLPAITQEVLKLAACIGNCFDLPTLGMVCDRNQEEVATNLWKGLQEGFVIPESETYKFFQGEQNQNQTIEDITVGYRFLHDRVQQAAYSLIPKTERGIAHYQIGQLLLQKIPPEAREERIFELINQLNHGTNLITEQKERDDLAQLNLTACRKARAATAYQAAYDYATIGITLLREKPWQRQYGMTLTLHELAAEIASLTGEFEEMEAWIEAVVHHSKTSLDRIQTYQVKIQALTSRNEFVEAIATGKFVLELLGATLPDTPTLEDVQQARQEITDLIGDRSVAEFVHLPQMKEPEKLAILQISTSLIPACYMTGSMLYLLIVPLQVKLSIQFGNSLFSPYSYASYAFQLSTTWQDMAIAQRFGQLAYHLASEPEAKNIRAATFIVLGGYFYHCTSHLRKTLPILIEGIQAGLETGNLEFFGYNVQNFGVNAFWSCQSLADYETQIHSYHQQLLSLNQVTTSNHCFIYWQSALTLLGNSEGEIILRQDIYEEKIITEALAANDTWRLFQFYFYRLATGFILDQLPEVQQDANRARQYLSGCVGSAAEPIFYFYDSLIALTELEETSLNSETQWQRLQDNQEILHKWASHAPMNYLHKWQLVEAERQRVLGGIPEAIEYYEQAIMGAKENEYIQEEALANELAAKFYLNWGKEKVASGYMQEAYYCYAHWGAKAKVSNLESNYSQLLAPILNQPQSVSSSEESILESTSNYEKSSSTISLALDFAALLKASQSLSKEIELDKLLAALLKLIIENAGANKCVLMLNKAGQLQVEAVMVLGQSPHVMKLVPVEASRNIARNLINTVKRTLKSTVIMDATVHPSLSNDSYVQQHQPKSLLCTPLLYQGKLLGIVYLENNLVVGAFTANRVEVVNLLCTQAAISIENAQLYQQLEAYSHTLEEKVEARTKQLKVAQRQIISQEKLASLGALTAGVAHELRNPLNFVNNYAEGSAELSVDLLEAIEEQSAVINPEDLEYLKEIVVDLKDNAAAIQQHGRRAASIILNMMQHSRSDDSVYQKTNLNKLLEEARQLAYHSKRSIDNHFNITFATHYDESIGEVEVFSSSLNRAFINLIDNACYAAWMKYQEQGEPFIPKLSLTTRKLTEQVEIRIRDNGIGISQEIVEKIFNPFFTTKPTGEGTGLGLSLTHEIIVGQHRGSLQVETELSSFTEFILTLPAGK